jgi:hypothetical protein
MGEKCPRRETIAMSFNIRVNFIVEGQTEETFVNTVLREPLANCGIYINARSVEVRRRRIKATKYFKPGKQFKIRRGGLLDFDKAKSDINRWISEDNGAYLTTMFDLYALPDNFPKFNEAKRQTNPYEKVRMLEEGLKAEINCPRFIPYIQLHEFEGLLFSDINALDESLKPYHGGSKIEALRTIREQFNTPEEIDDGEETAPSKRLLKLYKSYEKPTDGSLIAKRIGLDVIRNECRHFNEWMVYLEGLAIYSHA